MNGTLHHYRVQSNFYFRTNVRDWPLQTERLELLMEMYEETFKSSPTMFFCIMPELSGLSQSVRFPGSLDNQASPPGELYRRARAAHVQHGRRSAWLVAPSQPPSAVSLLPASDAPSLPPPPLAQRLPTATDLPPPVLPVEEGGPHAAAAGAHRISSQSRGISGDLG